MIGETSYWIECFPVRKASFFKSTPGWYKATIHGFPELTGRGVSPNRAITKLRRQIEDLHRATGEESALPPHHSPLHPPLNSRDMAGWMSIYIDLHAQAGNCA